MNTYNTKLQNNNTNLSSILNTINSLPEAGSSSDVETCEVTFLDGGNCGMIIYVKPDYSIVYMDGFGAFTNTTVLSDVVKGSEIIMILSDDDNYNCSENIVLVSNDSNETFGYTYRFQVNGNGSISM